MCGGSRERDETYTGFDRALSANITRILSLEHLDQILRHRFVPSRLDMNSFLFVINTISSRPGSYVPSPALQPFPADLEFLKIHLGKRAETHDSLGLDHSKVEFVLIPPARLLPQFFDSVLLRMEITSSLDVVRMLLEQTELLPFERLRSLPVLSLLQIEFVRDHFYAFFVPLARGETGVSVRRVGRAYLRKEEA